MKNFIKVSLFATLTLISFMHIKKILEHDNNPGHRLIERREQIYDADFDDVDVLFLGGSKVNRDVTPIQVWKESNLVGINLATTSQPPIMTYNILKNFIDETNPQAVVIDLPGINTNRHPNDNHYANYFRIGYEFLDNKEQKKNIVNELDNLFDDFDKKILTFPFYRYHNRWSLLKEKDFVDEEEYKEFWIGGINEMDMSDKKLTLNDREYVDSFEDTDYSEEISKHYYQEIIELLKEKDIQPIIFVPPTAIPNYEVNSSINYFVEENDLTLLNYNTTNQFERMNFSNKGDFYDANHLSITGAKKFSTILANDLKELLEPKKQHDSLNNKLDDYYSNYDKYYDSRKEKFNFDNE